MAYDIPVLDISKPTATDLAANQFYLIEDDGSGNAKLVAAAAQLGITGVLQNDPASGQVATVRVAGVTKCVAGAAVAAGAMIVSNAAGEGVTYGGTGGGVVGIAQDAAAAAGDLFSLLLLPIGTP